VEAVSTPEENIVKLPYFCKKKLFKRIQTVLFITPPISAKTG